MKKQFILFGFMFFLLISFVYAGNTVLFNDTCASGSINGAWYGSGGNFACSSAFSYSDSYSLALGSTTTTRYLIPVNLSTTNIIYPVIVDLMYYDIGQNVTSGSYHYLAVGNPYNIIYSRIGIRQQTSNTDWEYYNSTSGTFSNTGIDRQIGQWIPIKWIIHNASNTFYIAMFINNTLVDNKTYAYNNLGLWFSTEISNFGILYFDNFLVTHNYTEDIGCIEDWILNNSESCTGINYNYTISYYDNNTCETYEDIPVDNSSIINCDYIIYDSYAPLDNYETNNTNISFLGNITEINGVWNITLYLNDTPNMTLNDISTIGEFSIELLSLDYGVYDWFLNAVLSNNSLINVNTTLKDFEIIYDCSELWIQNNSECHGVLENITITYYDFNNCGSYDNIPIDNNTIIECEYIPCSVSWSKTLQPCISDVKLIVYEDLNECNLYNETPSDNNTYEVCTLSATQIEVNLSEGLLPIAILFVFIIISIVCGATIMYMFFYLTALLFGLLGSLMYYYQYSSILIVACFIMTIFFVIVSLFLKRRG